MHKPVRRLVPRFLAFLTAPAVMLFDNLLAAAVRAARGVCEVLGTDMHDRATRRKVFGLVTVHTELGVTDIGEEAKFVAVESASTRAGEGTGTLCLELLGRRVEPSPEPVGLGDIGIYLHD